MNAISSILRFNLNIPEVIALQGDSGRHVQGRHGEQVMYVPPYVEQRIEDLAIAPGEPFEVCKTGTRDGPRRWIEWHVQRSGEPRQPNESANFPAAGANGSEYTKDHRNGSTNGHCQTGLNPAPNLTVLALPAPATGTELSTMETALHEVVSIARQVEAGAAANNYFLHFNNEDIRAIGVLLFIQLAREGAFR